MSKIPCEVVEDLLPLYIDQLTSDTTNRLVREHIEECGKCKNILEAMRDAGIEPHEIKEEEKMEIDFLKKNKKKNRKIMIGSLVAAAFVVCAVLFLRLFIVGDDLYGDWINCEIQVEGNHVVLRGTAVDSEHGISKVKWEEKDGVVRAVTKAVRVTPFYGSSFQSEFTASEEIKQVCINDRILWEDGEEIEKITSEVFETRHDYVGDMSANARTANALNLSACLGAYSNELETESQPYKWKILLKEDISPEEKTIKESDMVSLGYVILAVTGNLDEVVYEYTADGEAISKVVTKEEATKFLGQDIKDCGSSVRLLSVLMKRTGIERIFAEK